MKPANKKWSSKKCTSCEGGLKPLPRKTAAKYLTEIPGWKLSKDAQWISCDYLMKNFLAATAFIRKIAQTAEAEGHHPDLHLTGYRKLRIEISTHAIGGLSENDFILAAKISALPKKLKKV